MDICSLLVRGIYPKRRSSGGNEMNELKPNEKQPVIFWGGQWVKKSELERQLGQTIETGGANYVLQVK